MIEEVFDKLDSLRPKETEEEKENNAIFKTYFEEFLKKYPWNNYQKICKVSFLELLKAVLLIEKPNLSSEIIEISVRYSDIFEKEELIRSLICYYNEKEFHDCVDHILNTNFFDIKVVLEVEIYCISQGINSKFITMVANCFAKNKGLKKELENIFKGLSLDFLMQMSRFFAACRIYESEDFLNDITAFKIVDISFPHRKRKKKITNPLDQELRSFYSLLETKYNHAISEIKAREKNRKRNNKRIDEIMSYLKEPGEITKIDTIFSLCINEEMQEIVIDFILKHNELYYQELEQKLNSLKETSEENLMKLFAKYNYSYNSLSQDTRRKLKENRYQELEELLTRLTNIGITEPLDFTLIDRKKLEIIEELIKKSIINNHFLNEHHELLYENNLLLEQLLQNIDLLSFYGINIINYQNSLSILLLTNLKSKLILLALYGVSITKMIEDINFLAHQDLEEKLDILLISGDCNNEHLNDLNKSLEELNNMRIAKELDVPVELISLDSKIFTYSNNLVPEHVKEIFQKNTRKMIEFLDSLLGYQTDRNTLNINGIFVSIPRVFKNLSKLDEINEENIFYAIIYNSFYTIEEIDIIRSALIPEKEFYTLNLQQQSLQV